jgi:cellulose synthase/poly-beta-1,6-N-acetylglucosamine synthase-like glycosyltransferase
VDSLKPENHDSVSERTSFSPTVTLVIPARNAAQTICRCLNAVMPLLYSGELCEVIVVDDGSTDDTRRILERYPVTLMLGAGQGPGAARNLGWRRADSELIWFVDADCEPQPNTLRELISHFKDPVVAAVGGTYSNLHPDSLLATLIQEEIAVRHSRMSSHVNFLATFNVVYRRLVLERTGGFDESFKLAQDAELAYRTIASKYSLCFESRSVVGHHHPVRLLRYLKTQARQGFYRVMLYRRYPSKMAGDDYSSVLDHLQPVLACGAAALVLSGLIFSPINHDIMKLCFAGVAAVFLIMSLSAVPLAYKIAFRARRLCGFLYVLLAMLRSFARGCGLLQGLVVFRIPHRDVGT